MHRTKIVREGELINASENSTYPFISTQIPPGNAPFLRGSIVHLKERTCLFTFKCGSDTSKLCIFRQSTSVLSGYRRWNTYMLTVCRHYVKCLHTQGPSCGPSGVAPQLVIISGLPSSPVLFPPHFLNYVKLPQKCKPLQLNLTITSLVLLKITHLVLCGVLLE